MDVFDLFAKISLDTSEYEQGLSDASSKGSSFADTLKNGLAKAAKIGTAALGTAATAIGKLTKSAVENYAEFEQLIGGVETLFKDSADVVSNYAANAYKTAGLSANEYMETVTSFAASLLRGLGDDTAAAAEIADMAITDMADNANKMGTAMESIQNAYQGFSKQNYTMLDNLKLGYGGSATEMGRLLNDSGVLDFEINVADTQTIGAQLQEAGFDKMIEAIHVIQEKMGIAGTTAKEAGETISGSLSAAKSAWQNLVTGMADDSQDFEVLVENLVDSVATAGDNLLPRIEVAIGGIGKLIDGLAPQITGALPGLIDSLLPPLLEGAASLVSSVAAALPSMAGTITQQLPGIVTQIADVVPQVAAEVMGLVPMVAEAGIAIVLALADGAVTALPELIPAAVQMIDQLVMTITDPATLTALLPVAVDIITVLAEGIMEAVPQLMVTAVQIVTNLVTFISEPGNLEMLISTAVLLIETISGGLVDAIPQLFGAATQLILSLIDYIADPQNIVSLMNMALELVAAIAKGLVEAAIELVTGADQLIRELIDKFLETDWGQVGSDIVSGLLNGIKQKWTDLKNWWSEKVSGLITTAEKVLGINSPSKVFKEIGRNMVEGLGIGWSENIGEVTDKITASLLFTTPDMSGGSATSTVGAGQSADGTGGAQADEGTMAAATAAQDIVETLAKALIDMATLRDELGTGIVPDPSFETAAIEMIEALMNFLLHDEDEINVNKINETMADVIEEMAEGLEDDENQKPLEDAANDTIDTILKPFDEAYSDWVQVGEMIDQGIGEGIQNGWPWLEQLVAQLAQALYDAACAALGINSPSKLFMRIGDGMAEGLGLGWEKAFAGVKKTVVSDLDFGTATLKTESANSFRSPGYSLVQNIYSKAQTPSELLEESHMMAQKAVFLGV